MKNPIMKIQNALIRPIEAEALGVPISPHGYLLGEMYTAQDDCYLNGEYAFRKGEKYEIVAWSEIFQRYDVRTEPDFFNKGISPSVGFVHLKPNPVWNIFGDPGFVKGSKQLKEEIAREWAEALGIDLRE